MLSLKNMRQKKYLQKKYKQNYKTFLLHCYPINKSPALLVCTKYFYFKRFPFCIKPVKQSHFQHK